MKLKLLTVMVLAVAGLLGACMAVSDGAVDMTAVEKKLNAIDAYKEGLPDNRNNNEVNTGVNPQLGNLRSFYFGMSKEIVRSTETLTLDKEFTDALDYTGCEIYGYDMLLTYWFNSDDMLSSMSYSMQGENYLDTVNSLMDGLRGDYGEPTSSGYYDTADVSVTFDSDDQARQAVDAGSTYYNAVWTLDDDIYAEMYARKIETGYDYWIYYTDYNYYEK